MATKATNIEFLLTQARNATGSLAGGTVTVAAAGDATSTPITIWLDRNKATPAANPYTLDSNGTAQLYADGLIKVVIKNAAGATVYTRDNLNYVDYLSSGGYQASDGDYASLNAAVTAIGSTPTTLTIKTASYAMTGSVVVPTTLALVFEYPGSLANSTYTTTINGPLVASANKRIFTGTGAVSGLKEVRPEWWGAVADGTTDDSTAINAASAALSTGGALIFAPGKTYIISLTWLLNTKSNIVVEGNMATIKSQDGSAIDFAHRLIDVRAVTNSVIRDLIFDGNRANRTPAELPAHSVYIANDTKNVLFDNVISKNAVCDNYYIMSSTLATQSTYPTDIEFRNCEGTNAYRNNMTIINGLRITVNGGRYHLATGTAPMAGIDVEIEGSAYGVEDFIARGVMFDNNGGFGITFVGDTAAVRLLRPVVDGCTFGGNVAGGVLVLMSDGARITNNNFADHPASITDGVISIGAAASANITLDGNHFVHLDTIGATKEAISVAATTVGPVTINNTVIDSITGRGLVAYGTVNVDGFSINDCTGTPILLNGSDNSVVRGLRVKTSTLPPLIMSSDNVVVDGGVMTNVSSTTTSFWATDSANLILRNLVVIQTSSIPAGSVAYKIDNTAPLELANLLAYSAGSDYTASNVLYASSLTGTSVMNIRPAIARTASDVPRGEPYLDASTGVYSIKDVATGTVHALY